MCGNSNISGSSSSSISSSSSSSSNISSSSKISSSSSSSSSSNRGDRSRGNVSNKLYRKKRSSCSGKNMGRSGKDNSSACSNIRCINSSYISNNSSGNSTATTSNSTNNTNKDSGLEEGKGNKAHNLSGTYSSSEGAAPKAKGIGIGSKIESRRRRGSPHQVEDGETATLPALEERALGEVNARREALR